MITAKQAREIAEKIETALYNIVLGKAYSNIVTAANEGKFFVATFCACPDDIIDMITVELKSNGFTVTSRIGNWVDIKW
jgi:hypothetical protein